MRGVLFADLLLAMRRVLRARVRNGEVTERGLARLAGISQPHLHNMLKGVRALSAEKADLLLNRLELSVVDLLDMVPASAWERADRGEHLPNSLPGKLAQKSKKSPTPYQRGRGERIAS